MRIIPKALTKELLCDQLQTSIHRMDGDLTTKAAPQSIIDISISGGKRGQHIKRLAVYFSIDGRGEQ
jgi:hypothetical protein